MAQPGSTAGNIITKTYNATQFIDAVDLSPWDLGTACGSCHVGGGFVEKDRNGRRFSSIGAIMEAAGAQTPGSPNYGQFDPYLFSVKESFDPITGFPSHTVQQSPWAFPYFANFDPTQPVTAPQGWGQENPTYGIVAGQLIMPNVKEMDCLFCHFTGYNNLMSSVMVQSGMNFFAPSIGSDIIDRNSLSPTYQGYNEKQVDFGEMIPGMGQPVTLNAASLAKINKQPAMNNCKQCHNASDLKDIPDMMRDFLAAAPMIYTGNASKSPFTGLEMPSFDFNAPFGNTWNWDRAQYGTSPVLTKFDIFSALGYVPPLYTPDATKAYAFIPSIGFPAAMGPTVYNSLVSYDPDPTMQTQVGGGNPAGTGPLYYEAMADATHVDQNSLKRSTVPFPRADWFKRGDLFGDRAQEVHNTLGCAGCHMGTKTTKVDNFTPGSEFDGKSLCDPGRGYDSASLTETPSAAVAGKVVASTTDSRNTVKRCENCHIPAVAATATTPAIYKNATGDLLTDTDRFGAADPTGAHASFGLISSARYPKNVQAMKSVGGVETPFIGTHLDVIDCAVCHTYKKQMVVRMLDSTSGNRYPGMYGVDPENGMMGMFTDPMPGVHNEYPEWTPLFTWQKFGNGDKTGATSANWRRMIYPVNIIFAAVWNNEGSTVDHNGDEVNGRLADETRAAGNTPFDIVTKYDPPIARHMKAGMNFGPSGFAPVPIGFGYAGDGVTGSDGAYDSAYAPDHTFSGKFQYVGLYGGNINLSTPEEIATYKAYRTAKATVLDNKSWDDVKLLWLGGPYMITHNVRKPSNWVKGTSCADCHAADKEMFTGGFNTTGLAIKATAGGNFMQSQAEILTVVANKEDLATGAELATKTGAAREITFEAIGDWNGATKTFTPNPTGDYKKVLDLKRDEALYPDENVYYKVTDTAHTTPMTRAQWVTYLTTLAAPANAVIATINGTTSTGGTSKIDITAGANVALVATTTGNGADTTYTWTINDVFTDDPARPGYVLPRTLNGAAPDATTFTKIGTFTVTLTAKSPAGDTTEDTQTVYVKPVSTDGTGMFNLDVTGPFPTAAPAVSDLFLTWTETPGPLPTYTKAVIVWGDGSSTTTATADLSGSVSHAYKRLLYYSDAKGTTNTPTVYTYKTKFYFYNGAKLVAKQEKTITLAPTSDLVLKERLVKSAVSSNATAINYNLKRGAEVYLVFSLNNKGPGTNTGITVDIPALPTGMTILSGTTAAPVGATKGSYTVGGDWTGIGLTKGQTAYLTLRVKLATDATFNAVYTVPAAAIDTTAATYPDSVTNAKTATKLLNITAK